MKKTILCLSFEQAVSAGRRAALEAAGYAVVATTRSADAVEMLSSVAFDLVIIGDSCSASEKRNLAVEAKEKGTPVMLICGAPADAEIPADVRVYAVEGTAGLVSIVANVLPKVPSNQATSAA